MMVSIRCSSQNTEFIWTHAHPNKSNKRTVSVICGYAVGVNQKVEPCGVELLALEPRYAASPKRHRSSARQSAHLRKNSPPGVPGSNGHSAHAGSGTAHATG